MKERRVLILSEAFGSGHTKAAEALQEGLLQLRPDWKVHVYELGSMLRPTMNQAVIGAYLKTLHYSPKLWGVIYRKAQAHRVDSMFSYLLQRVFYTHLAHTLKRFEPHLIICTHPFPSAAISRLKRAGVSIPLYTVITDYAAHGAWISSNVDRYYVPSKQVKEQMIGFHVRPEQIETTGIPVSPKFWQKREQKKIRQQLQLTNLPTVLIMGGGLGIGLSKSMLQTLYQFREKLQILFVTGKNTSLYNEMIDNRDFSHPNFHLYGFVENTDELMDAADLLMTKPGGVTCTEAMAKQLPIIMLKPIPGQEEDNFLYMLEQKLGIPVSKPEELELLLTYLIDSPSIFQTITPGTATPRSGCMIIEITKTLPVSSQQ